MKINIFKKKKPVQESINKVRIINDDANNIYNELGITKERAEEIIGIANRALVNPENKSTGMAFIEMQNNCTHINEYTYALMVYARMLTTLAIQRGMLEI